ncbi:MAG: STAS domain-containing protein, partial [Candidatus Omnitrophica bacterium]|nr:STAS domain-containing protein [Candidatus Omnitrophota bacterium]
MCPEAFHFTQTFAVEGSIVIWQVNGFLQEARIAEMKQKLNEIIAQGITNIIFDFEGLIAVDSRGLGFLISVQKEVRQRNGRMVMVHMTAQFAALLELTKLNRIFEIFLDMETAKRSFGG